MIVALVEGEFGQDPPTTAEIRFGIAPYVGEMLLMKNSISNGCVTLLEPFLAVFSCFGSSTSEARAASCSRCMGSNI